MADDLTVWTTHRADCRFGPGFYRLVLHGGSERYVKDERAVRAAAAMLPEGALQYVQRDGHCLDGDRSGDANTPDVVDAEQWLSWPRERAMREVGLVDEADYRRVYLQVESAVSRRGNRESQDGVHVPIVIKRAGRPLIDVLAVEDE